MIKKRILILTSSTGSGHDSRAYAIQDWLSKLYGKSLNIKVEHFLENSSKTANFGVNLYNVIQKYIPFFHYIYWFIIEFIGQLAKWNLIIGKKHFKELIKEFKPNLIISVHDFLNLGYFELAREILGKENVRCVTYCGEFSGGFGFSRNWINKSADWYISRTSMAQDFAFKLGILKEKSSIYLGLFSPYVHEEILNKNEKLLYLVNNLLLKKRLFTVFITTGGNGANNHIDLLNILLNHKDKVQAIVVCGRNELILQKIRQWKKQNPNFNLFLEGNSKRVHKLIQVSDIVIAKGGGNTAAQCLFLGTPIIFNRINKMMPQERVTVKFFEKNNATKIFSSTKDFEELIILLKTNKNNYNNLLQNFQKLKQNELHPKEFFKTLVDLTKKTNEA